MVKVVFLAMPKEERTFSAVVTFSLGKFQATNGLELNWLEKSGIFSPPTTGW